MVDQPWKLEGRYAAGECVLSERPCLVTRSGPQSPPLATMWIYAVVQLNLLPAILSLALVVGYGWWKGLKLVP